MSVGLDSAGWTGLAVALGSGLLVGIERERRKGQGPDRQPAGIRSFALAGSMGAIAQLQQAPLLVAAGALTVGGLCTVAYWKSRSQDPGLTTELALLAIYLIGALSVASPALGAACGAGLAALLAWRAPLHRLSQQWLSEREMLDLVLLAALALIGLPLVPGGPQPWLGGLDLRTLATLAVLILALQAAGHLATRALGARAGWAATGFFGGFVSSSAMVATLGAHARRHPQAVAPLAAAALLSSAATWLQLMAIVAALRAEAVQWLAPCAAAGVAGALAAAGAVSVAARGLSPEPIPVDTPVRALRLREAAIVAAVLSGVALAVSWAQARHGDTGLYAGLLIGAAVDAHAAVASVGALFAGGRIDAAALVQGALLAVTVNTVTRAVIAHAAGGWRYGWRVSAGLFAGTGLAWLVAGLSGKLQALA